MARVDNYTYMVDTHRRMLIFGVMATNFSKSGRKGTGDLHMLMASILAFAEFLTLAGCKDKTVPFSHPGQMSYYDFGRVSAGTDVHKVFNLRNDTEHARTILRVGTSCGCTVASHRKTPILPGQTGHIEVLLDTSNKNGKVSETIQAHFDDETVVSFALGGFVESGLIDTLEFGEVLQGKPIKHVLDVSRYESLGIDRLMYNEEVLDVERKDGKLFLSTDAAIPFGPFSDTVTLFTNDSMLPVKRIIVNGLVLRPFELREPIITLGQLEKKKTVKRQVEMWSPYGFPIEDAVVEQIAGPAMSWTIEKQTHDSALMVLQITPETDPSSSVYKSILQVSIETNGFMNRHEVQVFGLYRN